MKREMLIVTVVSIFAAVGCAAASAPEETSEPTEAALSTTATTRISGTFDSVGTNSLNLPKSFSFNPNGTYQTSSSHGTWTLAKVSGQLKITLDDRAGGKESYFFSLDGNTITFNKTLQGSTAYFFDKSWTKRIPLGDVCQDDTGKSLGECQDSGNFACGENGFSDVLTCNPLD